MKYSIVIPCYNEEENLPKLIETLIIMSNDRDIEFLLIENGSNDNSYEVMKGLIKNIPFIKIVKVDVNQGLGYGIQQGIKAAGGDYIGWIHADMQTPVSDIVQLFDSIESSNTPKCMVKATRHNRSLLDYFFTNCMAVFCSVLFKKVLYDIQAVPVIVNRSLFDSVMDMPKGFAFDMFIYWQARINNFVVRRIPVRIFKREKGNSSWNTGINARIRLSRYMIKSAISIKKGDFNV